MNNQSINILTYLLIFMLVILGVLSTIFLILKVKEKGGKNKKNNIEDNIIKTKKEENKNVVKEYNKQSIFSFMEFDRITDNMIIKKERKEYLMVIGCQGINYDLMAGVEKVSVEQGFLQFLNTLTHPIQIYTQTRTVNLGSSINKYKSKIKEIQDKLVKTEMLYREKLNDEEISDEELGKYEFEVIKQRNLYEYGLDIIRNTEQMSFNKNILTKQYYIIIPYYSEEMEIRDFDKEEIKNIAFSELYTKAQSIISSLFMCGVNGKILDSTELTELLYIAYNRDESEIYELEKVLNSGYEELYSTAPDVFEKKIKELDKKIEEEAIRKANEILFQVADENKKEKLAKQKEEEIDKLIDDMAKMIIEQNKTMLGKELTEKAKEKIENKTVEEGGKENGNKNKKSNTTRKQ